MQDTESTDLLSTAVSSTRINEFADASHTRNGNTVPLSTEGHKKLYLRQVTCGIRVSAG